MTPHQTKRIEIARRNLIGMAQVPNVPTSLLVLQARLFLKSFYGGSLRMLYVLSKYELNSAWMRHGWPKWEWFRTRILRRAPDPALAMAQRVLDEETAVNQMSDEL